MTLCVDLLANKPVLLDDQTPALGGGFWNPGAPRVYDPVPIRWVADHLKDEQPILVDVGASTGCFTLLAAHIPALRVYAFEPAPLARDLLIANVYLNHLADRVFIGAEAVSDQSGEGIFHVVDPPSQIGLSLLEGAPTYYKAYHDVRVAVIALDDYFKDEAVVPTVLKIDTEGNELAVLQGATRLLRTCKPAVVCEYAPPNTVQYGYHPNVLIAFLQAFGYTVIRNNTDLYAEAV